MDNNFYDENESFKNEILLHINKVEELCHAYRLPLFLTVATANDDNKTSYYTKVLQPMLFDKSLNDDKFTDLLCVMKGFSTFYNDKNAGDDVDFTSAIEGVEAENVK